MAVALFRSQVLQGQTPALARGADDAALCRRKGQLVADVQLLLPLPKGKFDTYGAPKTELVEFTAAAQERETKWNVSHGQSYLKQAIQGIKTSVVAVRRHSAEAVQFAAQIKQHQEAVDARIKEQDRKMQLVRMSTQTMLDIMEKRKLRRMKDERGRRRSFLTNCESQAMNRWGRLRAQGSEIGHKRVVQKDVEAVRIRLKHRHASVTGTSTELEEARSLAQDFSQLDDGAGTRNTQHAQVTSPG